MSKQVSQATFDTVVRENMEEFDMEAAEAVEDAVSQFEAQGVNLSNIVRDLSLYSKEGGSEEGGPAKHAVVEALEKLSAKPGEETDVKDLLSTVKQECNIDLAHRLLAGANEAFPTLFNTCKAYKDNTDVLCQAVDAMCSLCNGQPDLVTYEAMSFYFEIIKLHHSNPQVCAGSVRFIKLSCIMHETNRQSFVSLGLISTLISVLGEHAHNAEVVKEVCGALRVLTLDDDVRVPFGKGHEHAKMIVTEQDSLRKILDICKDYESDVSVLGELFSTLARLAVRNEFCQEIMDLGGLQLMLAVLRENIKHMGFVKQVLGVLKAIAGNDQVKVAIATHGGIELILAAMTTHARQSAIAEMGCAAIATVTLRQPEHCKKVMQAGGGEVIVKAMQLHPDQVAVQQQACMALRNLVARTRENTQALLNLGAEKQINDAMQRYPDVQDAGKAALRDMDCKVELRCLWKGEGVTMAQ